MPRPSRWNEIVQAAAEEFREQGFEGSTIEAIAARVGILKGSLYNYITNKEDLLFAVIEEPAQRLLRELHAMEQARDEPATARLRRVFHIQIRIFTDHYPAAFVYLQQIGRPSHREDFRAMDRQYIEAIEAVIVDGVAQGEFPSAVRPAVAARGIVGMLDWMQHWFVPRDDTPPDVVADELLALAVGGLAGAGLVRASLGLGGGALPPLREAATPRDAA